MNTNSEIRNGSPAHYILGTDDQSKRAVPEAPSGRPTYLNYWMLFTEKGTTNKQTVMVSSLPYRYGLETFNRYGKYFNFATEYVANGGKIAVIKRLKPDDAGPNAGIAIYIDILECKVPNYARYSDGSLVKKPSGVGYVVDAVTPDIDGCYVKIVSEPVDGIGNATTKNGTMTNPIDNTVSVMYPILEVHASEFGEAYNRLGFSIVSRNRDTVDPVVNNNLKALVYDLMIFEKTADLASTKNRRSLSGAMSTPFTFVENGRNVRTDQIIDLETVFNNDWFNDSDTNKAMVVKDLETPYVYRQQLETALKKLASVEKAHVSQTSQIWADDEVSSTASWHEFTTTGDDIENIEFNMVNPFTLASSNGVKYIAIQDGSNMGTMAPNQAVVKFTSQTPVYLTGGSDGTMNDSVYNMLVAREFVKYADQDDQINDLILNPESSIVDPGFNLTTKYAMVSALANRPDIFLKFSTHDAMLKKKSLSLAEQRAIAVAIKARLALYPESVEYNTPVCRAMIFIGTGTFADKRTTMRIPLTYEFDSKAHKFMGGADGNWDKVEIFDAQSKSIFTELVDIDINYIPKSIKPGLWQDGIVWPFNKSDRNETRFEALRTAYNDDTSILNSPFIVSMICDLNKIAEECYRNFTGSSRYNTDTAFLEAVQVYLESKVSAEKYANIVTYVKPVVYMLDNDKIRGYLWRVDYEFAGMVTKTVQVTSTRAFRSDADVTTTA